MKKLCVLLTLCLLMAALPALAAEPSVVHMENPQQVLEATGLLLPIPYYADSPSYSVVDGTIAQVNFKCNSARCTLRLTKTAAFEDISGVSESFEMWEWYMEDYEGLDSFTCTSGINDHDQQKTLWFDKTRGVSGSLYMENVPNTSDAEAEQILFSLARGVCISGKETYKNGSYILQYPVMLTEDEARTEKINRSITEIVETIGTSHGNTASYEDHYDTVDYYNGRMTIEWGGWVSMPGAAYSSFEIVDLTIDLATGEPAPLHTQIDTAEYAELILHNLNNYYSYGSADDLSINAAQIEHLAKFTLEDWKALLDNADFPSEQGWPSAFSRWSHDEYETCLLLNIPMPHAIGDVATLEIELDAE